MGNGRQCEEMGGKRKKMSEYMMEFKTEKGYIYLKEEYLNTMKKLHNKIEGNLESKEDAKKNEISYVAKPSERLVLWGIHIRHIPCCCML